MRCLRIYIHYFTDEQFTVLLRIRQQVCKREVEMLSLLIHHSQQLDVNKNELAHKEIIKK